MLKFIEYGIKMQHYHAFCDKRMKWLQGDEKCIYLKMKEDGLFILKSKPDTEKDKTVKIGA